MGFKHIEASIFAPVTPTEKLVLLVLAYHCNDKDLRCHPGFGRISRASGLSTRAVSKTIKALEKQGIINVIRGTGTTSSAYRLPFLNAPFPDIEKGDECCSPLNVVHPTPEPDSPQGMNVVQVGDERGSSKQEVNRNIEKEDNMNLFPASLSADDGGEQGKPLKSHSSKPKKVKSEADPRHHEITSQWGSTYRAFHGQSYVFNKKDVSNLKRFLADDSSTTAEQFLHRAQEAWKRAKEDPYARQCASAATITGLCSRWNDITLELQRARGGGNVMRFKNGRDDRGQRPGEIKTDVTADKIPRIK
ncbi:helix-turn-helix protein [Roseimicrobium gellanilyticum]|uniref:Helix-turn-helix protein n=1 Tax=Roseimicrobium gellanilyticum TaxID=748857 RepID=A0A366HI32_9BACT|nr:helix-turn-helix domain-containing protein [Roseimicrobium gellanilyticum]RBP42428.1 helix-turn-helix protein [Roseimicrobium gellanilyticum]